MIKNQRQYEATQAQISRFEAALVAFDTADHDAEVHPRLIQAQRDSLVSQLQDLRDEVREYDDVRSGRRKVLELESLAEIPAALIRARIAAGLSQRDLAQRLGCKEQQIQRYEATDYAGASLGRLQEVADALQIGFREDVLLPGTTSLAAVAQAARPLGIDRDFLRRRLSSRRGGSYSTLSAISNLNRVYGVPPAVLFGDAPVQLSARAAAGARFKVGGNANPERLTAYAVYAHYLALLALHATEVGAPLPIPTNPTVVHQEIAGRYGHVDLSTTLAYVWSLGIPVLPLDDPGGFHGACFRSSGRNVIVLKQRTPSPDRWLFDLLHELRHAGEAPNELEREVIEIGAAPLEKRDSPEEIVCNRFAGEVALDGRAEELAQRAVERAGGRLERLKLVVPKVASDAGVRTGALANYLAFRLSRQNENWWPAAQNLQDRGDPWQAVRDEFIKRVDFGLLSAPDRDLLVQALTSLDPGDEHE